MLANSRREFATHSGRVIEAVGWEGVGTRSVFGCPLFHRKHLCGIAAASPTRKLWSSGAGEEQSHFQLSQSQV